MVSIRPVLVVALTGPVVIAVLAAGQTMVRKAPAPPPGGRDVHMLPLAAPSPDHQPPKPTPQPPTPQPPTAQPPTRSADLVGALGTRPTAYMGTGPYGSIRVTNGDSVALTFDDGPDPIWTPRILAVLRRSAVTATFCLVGVRARAHPHLVRAIADDGHTFCNHSWNHNLQLGRLSPASIRADLKRTNAAIRAAVPNARIVYFRQPGGRWTASVVEVARQLGLASLHWTVDPQDWRGPPASTIVVSVTRRCRPGAIILLHDGGGDRSNTLVAVRSFLPALVQRQSFSALPAG